MKTLKLTLLCILLGAGTLSAQPLWMRYPSISPDGKEIAFSYKGDIYKVAAAGGEAKQITMHQAYEYMPIWSPDGKSIAFVSDRYGNFDIFIVSTQGGTPKRLTTYSGGESPYTFTPDGKFIVYGSKIQAPAASAAFPSGVMSELYKISVDGNGRPIQMLATPAENISFSKDGKQFVFQDRKGSEDRFRKHHTSSVTRDIWLYDIPSGKFTQLIDRPGEDNYPVFSPDNSKVFFLSEKSGTYNVHSFDLKTPSNISQVTNFKTHPVRFLTISGNGTLCFGYDGEIYTQAANGKAQKVKINITEEAKTNNVVSMNVRGGGQAISPDGAQVAVVARGELYVSSFDYKYTKRITNTTEAEEDPAFSPDGKTLVYSSERDGVWNLYTAKSENAEPFFFNATLIKEEPLFSASKTERLAPKYSPDGKEIAYIEDRDKLMVYNIESKKTRQITDGSTNYNTSGAFSYEWSPDGKWFAISYIPNRHDPYGDIGLVSSQGGKIVNITNSGYMSVNPKWALGGNAIMFMTDRYGMRSHASWGSMNDVMLVFLNKTSYDKFTMSEDDYKLMKEEEKLKKPAPAPTSTPTSATKPTDPKAPAPASAAKATDTKPAADAKPANKDIVVEFKDIEDRIVRLTPNSSQMGDAILSSEGDKLFYLAAFEKGFDLWSINCRTMETKIEIKGAGSASLVLDKDGKNLFMLGYMTQKYALTGGKRTPAVFQPDFTLDLAAEREYMFNHVWTQEFKRFYVKDMHGVDWNLMKKEYSKYLPYITNNYDFAEMLSELLGELNVSHTGGRYSPSRMEGANSTSSLGLMFSWSYDKDGLLIDEIVEKGPFDINDTKVKAGCVIEKIDGEKITANVDYFILLDRKQGKKTRISFHNPQTNERWDEVIKPISLGEFSFLLYNRWVKQREADVERLSNGRLGYVHIQSMADASFRSIYSDILGKFNNKEGIVIDTRFNGGGRMHEDIEVMFSGKKYFTQVIRGEEACDMPSRRWNKPSIMLMNESNYSNAHGTPWVYKNVDIGKLVGMPVPGTMTSVSWESLQDPSLVFGIPIVGIRLSNGTYLENQQLEPDFKVANSPAKLATGEDEQIAKAVEELIKQLEQKTK